MEAHFPYWPACVFDPARLPEDIQRSAIISKKKVPVFLYAKNDFDLVHPSQLHDFMAMRDEFCAQHVGEEVRGLFDKAVLLATTDCSKMVDDRCGMLHRSGSGNQYHVAPSPQPSPLRSGGNSSRASPSGVIPASSPFTFPSPPEAPVESAIFDEVPQEQHSISEQPQCAVELSGPIIQHAEPSSMNSEAMTVDLSTPPSATNVTQVGPPLAVDAILPTPLEYPRQEDELSDVPLDTPLSPHPAQSVDVQPKASPIPAVEDHCVSVNTDANTSTQSSELFGSASTPAADVFSMPVPPPPVSVARTVSSGGSGKGVPRVVSGGDVSSLFGSTPAADPFAPPQAFLSMPTRGVDAIKAPPAAADLFGSSPPIKASVSAKIPAVGGDAGDLFGPAPHSTGMPMVTAKVSYPFVGGM